MPFPPPGDLPDPGIQSATPVSLSLQTDSLLLSHWGGSKRIPQQLYANEKENLEEIDKFLEMYHPPKLNQEEMEDMNRPIISTEIETVIKKLSTKKSPRLDGFTGKFYQTFREEITPILRSNFKKLQRKEHSQTYSMRQPSL